MQVAKLERETGNYVDSLNISGHSHEKRYADMDCRYHPARSSGPESSVNYRTLDS
jgi:hypothetical protein